MQVKLPAVVSALQQQQLESFCTGLVDKWSLHWFGCDVDDCNISVNQQLFASLAELADCCYCQQGVALHYQPDAVFQALFTQAIPAKLAAEQLAGQQLVAQFADAVLHDLASRFSADGPLTDNTAGAEQWQLSMTLIVNCQPFVLRLSAARVRCLLQQCAPANAKANMQLVSRQQALQQELVSVTPQLGQVSMSLKQLLSLKVGSVIPLSQPIAEPIPLHGNNKVVSMAGYLVNQHGNKALFLTGQKHEQN